MTPETEPSAAENFRDAICSVALAHYCAFVGPGSEQFKTARAIGLAIQQRHCAESAEAIFDDMTRRQSQKIKLQITGCAMALLAKTIERNGGHGTLPKSAICNPQSAIPL